MNQPRRPRLIALTSLAILAVAFIAAPAYSSPPILKFIEVAERAQSIAEQLRGLAQSQGLDTTQADALIGEGKRLLGEARQAESTGNSQLAFSKARDAQSSLRGAIALLSATSVTSLVAEEVGKAQGILVAVQRARGRIADLRAGLMNYQAHFSVDQQSVESIAWVNANLTAAEGSLREVENALRASPQDVSSAAQSLAQAEKSIGSAFAAMPKIEFRTNAWRIPGFIKELEKLMAKIDAKLREAAGRGSNVQEQQAKMASVRGLVDSAKDKAFKGEIHGALALVKEARSILHSIEKDLGVRGRG